MYSEQRKQAFKATHRKEKVIDMAKIPKNGIDCVGIVTWNGFWYGMKTRYGKVHYYKSHNCRFDNTCGGTEEISVKEYNEVAEKYAKVFR